MAEVAADPELVETLEQCVINWLGQISYALDSQMKKKPQVFCAGPVRSSAQVPPPLHPRGGSLLLSVVVPLFSAIRALSGDREGGWGEGEKEKALETLRLAWVLKPQSSSQLPPPPTYSNRATLPNPS